MMNRIATALLRLAAAVRIFLGWLWLTRVSVFGLAVLLLLPFAARGGGRTLLIGAFDLHGQDVAGKLGAGVSGFLLAWAAWAVFFTAALTLAYGRKRANFPHPPPWCLRGLYRGLLIAAIALNVWTIIAATDAADRVTVGLALGAGLVLGLALAWGAEAQHRCLSGTRRTGELYFFPGGGARSRTPVIDDCPYEKWFLSLVRIFTKRDWRLPAPGRGWWDTRGYVGVEKGRTYLLPGHGLAALGTLIFAGTYFLINWWIRPDGQLTALAYVLVLLNTWILALSGITYFLDAYRIPVLLPLLAWLAVASLSPSADHFYRIWPASETVSAAQDPAWKKTLDAPPLTPAEVIARAAQRRIVLVAAAGGGIQSTAWTAKVLAELERVCGETERGRFARSVQVLSGVSGGSTGVMFFAQAYGKGGLPAPGSGDEPAAFDIAVLDRIAVAARATSLGQTTWGLAYPDLGRAFLPYFSMNPFRDRGEAMEQAWAFNARRTMQEIGEPLRTASLREWQADVRTGTRPVVIFNATIVESGDRMSFSTAPPVKEIEGRREFGRMLLDRDGNPNLGASFYPGADLRITTAARLSATFPFVSPSARPGLAQSRTGNRLLSPDDAHSLEILPGKNGKLHLGDGGYYENTGLSDLTRWLDDGLTELVGKKPALLPKEILVIQIEAFPETRAEREGGQLPKMEEQKAKERGVWFQFTAPLVTLNSVRGAGHTAFTNLAFDLLRHRYRHAIDVPPITIRHVRFVLPAVPAVGKDEGWHWPAWAKAQPEKPPLSWHLRGPEQEAIDAAWERLITEHREAAKTPLAGEQWDAEWENKKSRPIEKVLRFLAPAPPEP